MRRKYSTKVAFWDVKSKFCRPTQCNLFGLKSWSNQRGGCKSLANQQLERTQANQRSPLPQKATNKSSLLIIGGTLVLTTAAPWVHHEFFSMLQSIPFLDKLAHVLIFGLMTLWIVSIHSTASMKQIGRLFPRGLCLAVTVACVHELSHLWLQSRTFDKWDLIANLSGAFAFGWLGHWLRYQKATRRSGRQREKELHPAVGATDTLPIQAFVWSKGRGGRSHQRKKRANLSLGAPVHHHENP